MKSRNKSPFSKFLALMLAFAMTATLAPVTASAAGGDGKAGNENEDSVFTDKTVKLEDDGTYTINLEAYATGTVTEGTSEPCDIVLVLDQSTSMGANQFATSASYQKLNQNATNSTAYDYRDNLYYRTTGGEYIKVTVSRKRQGFIMRYYEYTYSAQGLATATSDQDNGSIPSPYRGNLYYYGSTSSMTRMEALTEAANNFVEEIADRASTDNVDYRVAIVGFASERESSGWNYEYPNTELLSTSRVVNYEDAEADDYKDALVSATGNNGQVNSRLTQAIGRLEASGDTYSEYGIDMANQIFANNSAEEGRNRAIVVFTDGYPAPSGTNDFNYGMADRAIANAYTAKTQYGASVYTVGIFDESDPNADINNNFSYGSTNASRQETAANRYMHYMSSNYPQAQSLQNGGNGSTDSGYYMSAHDTDSLNEIFQHISESISGTTVTLDANSEMRDILNTGFALPEGYDAGSQITAYTAEYLGNGAWDNPKPFSDAKITAADDVITISNFSYKDNYVVEEKTGDKQDLGHKLMVTIKGIVPTDEAVQNAPVNTNADASGIYATTESETPAADFPQPQTILTSKAYVLDYAKETSLTGFDQDVTFIVDNMRAVTAADTSATGTYGNSSLSGSSISYTPKTTNWDGYDNIYAFGKTSNEAVTKVEANENGNLWSRISVIPANNVYYEDDFVTNEADGTVGIEYSGDWKTEGTSSGNTETADNDVHGGWTEGDGGLFDDGTYSDGSAHVSDKSGASASFTFSGTGVDVYSRTNNLTGTIAAVLTGGPEGNTVSKFLAVDNYADSGDYYQIPTVSFSDLAYGEYTLTIYVTNAADTRATYYLDGIRVYNPIQDQESDEIVQGAYGEDELNAVFTGARELLQSGSMAFIDEDADGNTAAGDYTESEVGKLAPENEIYLDKDQSVVLKTDNQAGKTYYIGLKAPEGTANAEVTNGTGKSELAINHSTDLYYKVTPADDGTIVVKNTSDNLLSITKIREAGAGEAGIVENSLTPEMAVNAVNTFKAASYVPYENEAVTDNGENDEDVTDNAGSVEEGDVEIDNSDGYDDADETTQPAEKPNPVKNWISNLFNGIKNLFSRW